jgi:predicted ATP-dependent endonuclease of OLD family
MELTKFRVTNFRSIENSGEIEVSKIAALVGRNESGKSNLLLALASLNPKGKRKPLNPVKDFPRSRRLEECKDETDVVWTCWKLAPKEAAELATIVGEELETVTVGRGEGPAG